MYSFFKTLGTSIVPIELRLVVGLEQGTSRRPRTYESRWVTTVRSSLRKKGWVWSPSLFVLTPVSQEQGGEVGSLTGTTRTGTSLWFF